MRSFRLPAIVLSIALLFLLTSTSSADVDGHYQGFGDAAGFLNILPPGQDGQLNGLEALQAQAGNVPPHVADQLSMYGDLVYNTPGLTDAQLTQFFKDASFGVKSEDIGRVYSPTTGVTVIRDKSFDVPHIFGDTRYATLFAEGYTTAEDRLFLMDALRHVGRGKASEFIGAAPSNLALDREQEEIAPYTEADLTRQLDDAVANGGAEARTIRDDLNAYVDGVNKYITEATLDPTKLPAEYPALQVVPQPWKPEDAVAIASLVGGIFGKGGGGELGNYCGLQQLTANLGGDAAQARAIFNDLHFANDPEAPTTTSRSFPYMTNLGAVNPAAVPSINCSSLAPVDDFTTGEDDLQNVIADGPGIITLQAPWGPITMSFNDAMSNAILLGGSKTQTGHPIAVFGPQTSYYIPQLLVEKDVHGPGIDARGAAFAGVDLYVQLGRGRNYAWSATSAGGDNIDTFVLKLCEPSGGTPTTASMGYLRNGVCKPIETWNHTQIAKPTAGGVPAGPDVLMSWRIERTPDYGPVHYRGTLQDGTPIAVASLRTTYNNELGSARGFYRINNPDYMTSGYNSFRQAMGTGVDYTFNWFYIDANNIAYENSCKCPQRAQGVDAALPAWGDGRFDWNGYIPFDAHPWDLNPSKGYMTSWNNKQAPNWMANDNNFYYGPNYRSQLLDKQIERQLAHGLVDRADIVDAMEEAGTVDLRGQEDLSYLLQVLGPTAPVGVDPRAQEMRDRLATWQALDSHRRDHDHNGEYDDPQSPAIMDAWWPRLTQAIFSPAGDPVNALHLTIDDPNRRNHIGSSFQDGLYGHVSKDLRQVLGQSVLGSFSRTYCGDGSLAACRSALWASLALTASDLQIEFKNKPNVVDWKRQVADEDVRHSAVGVTGVPAIHWINRPTFQQVVQINGPQVVAQAFGSGSLSGPSGKKIAFDLKVDAYANGGGAGSFHLNDQANHQKIELASIMSAHAPAGAGCGSIAANSAHSFELTGSGKFNGMNGRTIHVCVQDNADPGKGLDRLHVDCLDCPYNTASPYSNEQLYSGNVKVNSPPPPPAASPGPPSVVLLDPALGGLSGAPATLTATVYDASEQPVPNAPVSLSGLGLLPLSLVTDALGRATYLAVPTGNVTAIASSGGIESNPAFFGP